MLRHERKAQESRRCRLLSGHAATGAYLCNKMGKIPSDKCWWCGRNKKLTRYHLFVKCKSWAPQPKMLWQSVGNAYGWKHPMGSRIEMLSEGAATAVLTFARDTKVDEIVL